MNADRLTAHELWFQRGKRGVLSGASLSLGSGEVVSLLGRNGAGKTTLLRLMLGLMRPKRGEVGLNGQPLTGFSKRCLALKLAYVPQCHQPPFPYLVREVVALGRVPTVGLFGRLAAHDKAVVEEMLERLRIGALADRPYTHLSGGERQLVMLARAMAQGARLLIMDEPLSGLDYGHQVRLLHSLRDLADNGYGVLLTTHHPDQARMVSSRVATLIDGKITQDGPPAAVVTDETIYQLYGVREEDAGAGPHMR